MSDNPQTGIPVPTKALWTWNNSTQGQPATVASYPTPRGQQPTKTGILRADLESFMGTPIQLFTNPPTPISDQTVIGWIRYAEDETETETNVRLCQTWIAAPPARSQTETQLLNLTTRGNYQQLGVDYDYAEPGYDFFF